MHAVSARHAVLRDRLIVTHEGTRVRERAEGDSVCRCPNEDVSAALAMARAVRTETDVHE